MKAFYRQHLITRSSRHLPLDVFKKRKHRKIFYYVVNILFYLSPKFLLLLIHNCFSSESLKNNLINVARAVYT